MAGPGSRRPAQERATRRARYAVKPGRVRQRDPHESTLGGSSIRPGGRPDAASPTAPVLELVWSSAEPERVGELFCLPRGAVDVAFTVGRAVEPDEGGALPLVLQQLRPCSRVDTGPLRDARVSRRHVGVRLLAGGGLLVERLGRGEVTINGHAVERAIAEPGDVIEAVDRFAVLYTARPAAWPEGQAWPRPFPFGAPDRDGLVGESPATWALRRQIAAVGPLGGHVLVHGPSGSGKELVVRALHAASPRAAAPLVSRSAATLPEPLIDVELFGNVRDFPGAGALERVGLLGEADRGALYLDELGELPHPLQARLMRVMDSGEYHRLGDTRRRICDLRVYGATNRDPAALKHDLLARFTHQIRVPGLDERPDDIPLLARQMLRGVAREHPELRARFFTAEGEPRLAPGLVAALVRGAYTGHVRELAALLWRSLTEHPGPTIEAPDRVAPGRAPKLPEPHTLPEELTREQIVAALAACDGVRELAWRHLGLQSRYQLKRLLKKFDIA
jgi:transcriptional regulator with AAA-type ATPase domain